MATDVHPDVPDHPRIRGEHCEDTRHAAEIGGSSPHTRGAPWNTPNASISETDHPRIRGEHALCSGISGQATGSSPHTRGARLRLPDVDPGRGIIPAYAGSTLSLPYTLTVEADHPRIRGEHV